MVIGYDISIYDDEMLSDKYDFDRYLYPEFYDCYDLDEIPDSEKYNFRERLDNYNIQPEIVINPDKKLQPVDITPMESPWPMHGHNAQHTGRSPYSTIDTWDEIWKFRTDGWAMSSPSIDKNETIYIGAYNFYAVNPNGTLKWMYDTGGVIESCCPAIDENGIIYVGAYNLYAFYPNGILKWKYPASGIVSSPVIGYDGSIYFADTNNWNIKALNPDGTLKWSYHTNHVIYSSPAIGIDGTVYCGSHDNYIYALYSNNGTLKWKYNTGSWVHGSPTIASDGTVYIGSDNGYLYAFYPNNGTVKWKVNIGDIYGSLAIGKDGILYTGVWDKKFYAIYPNGTIKWSFNTGNGKVWGSSPALSDDGTLYFGTCDLEWTGGIEIIALYTDGTVKWRKHVGPLFSSPAIGSDGTVYIGTEQNDNGYLVAFGRSELEADTNGPYYGLINEPVQFKGNFKGGYSPHSYFWVFGDTYTSEEQNPTHTYTSARNYTVTFTVTDNESKTDVDTTYAWIQDGNNPPETPDIDGPVQGNPEISYDYKFIGTDLDGSVIYLYVDWDDESNSGWLGPYDSGQEVTLSHKWSQKGTYTIKSKSKDPYDAESNWSEFEITIPRTRATSYLWLLERFPLLEKLLGLIRIH